MKTKIIYISGNELFDMADIRNAFEEVRAALSLGTDTVLFGVPVDNDDAFVAQQSAQDTVAPVIEPETQPITDTTPVADGKKEKPTRHAPKTAKVVPISDAISTPEPVAETETVAEPIAESAPVIPILSVLGSKTDDDVADVSEPETVPDVVDTENIEAESVTITDMIADEAPTEEHEKTLEELLESMTPLGEDAEKSDEQISINTDEVSVESETKKDDDIDITLEKLATEFVETQDKIDEPTKPAARGKIGKLKNILPFKKAKHDDSGLMGDLFGWAGVAANDEDFTMPGFFK